MRLIICFLLLFGLSVFPVSAQQSPGSSLTASGLTASSLTASSIAGPLEEILIEGTDDDVLKGRIRIAIDVEPGNLAENVQVNRVRQQVLELGLFREVRVELQSSEGKNVLLITVKTNPKIGSVEVIAKDIDIPAVKTQLLEGQLNIAPGVLLDHARLEEGRGRIAQVFRRYIYPFTPKVTLEVSDPTVSISGDDTVKVTYSVDASASVKSIRVSGATLVKVAEIEESFKRVLDKVSFDAQLYGTAIQRVSGLYAKLGYRGSGVSQTSSELVDGVLNVVINELKVVAIDAMQLGVEPEALTLQVGDVFNYDKLLENVRELNKSRDKQVGLKLEQPGEDTVVITITLEDAAAGPIKEIRFEGNTLISNEKLLERLRQRLGDTFNAIASQEDLSAISSAYNADGFALAATPEIGFLEGIYTIKLLEARVIEYQVNWQNPAHRTQDVVILRELPKPGLYSVSVIQKALQRINALEIIDPSSLGNITMRTPNPDKPEEIIVILNLLEAGTIVLEPNIGYSSRPGDGWSGSVRLSETNLFGLGNRLSLGLTTQPNPNATAWYDNFSGNLSYTVPWIDLTGLNLDFLDFKTVRTPISFTVFSSINQAQVIPGQDGINAKPVSGDARTYSTRASGFGITVGRPIAENLSLRFGINYSYQANSLERGDPAKLNPNLKDDAVAQAFLASQIPNSSTLTTFSEITYSTRNDANFPTGGYPVQASASYSFGVEGIQAGGRALNWTQYSAGFSTYLGFGFDQNGQFDLGENRNMALALRLNGGALLGAAPRNSQFQIGDAASGNEAFVLRGYDKGDLGGDVYYSGSLEYRYDFGLKTAFNNALLGIAFVDAANAWGNAGPRPDGIGEGVQFGYGLGAQLNLQLGSFSLPPLGFYYGWSPANPSGRFHFVFSFRF
jgi:outer membrane protein insertion porin family